MNKRLELHRILSAIPGVKKAYFQPPASVKMAYPCIVYELDDIDIRYADDKPYSAMKGYTITVIDPDPDSEIKDHVAKLPYCRFDRHYTVDNLNHETFRLYY